MDTNGSEEQFKTLFDYAPVSLWEENFSGIKRLFGELRERGIESLAAYLDRDPEFVDVCMAQVVVVRVNRQTLALFRAASQDDLVANLYKVFREGMRPHFRSELLALWDGEQEWAGEGVNYTLDGAPLDVLLHWRILPGSEESWEQVLVSIEDITDRKRAERRLQAMFEASPVSLWEEDYRQIKAFFDRLRLEGVTDLQAYIHQHPEMVSDCMGLIRVLDVNQKTLEMFEADSKEHLLSNLNQVFRGEMEAHFASELVDLWNGVLAYERDGINYTLKGEPLNIHLDFCVMPGHEQDFGWVLVAIQDITARKKAEEYLRYLGTHDVLTGLYNRAFFEDALLKLEKIRRDPVSIIIADLDGLKHTNDTLGHQAGDNLIRRAAEVFKASFEGEHVTARIGGDEFVVILPDTDERVAREALDRIRSMVDLNNKYYREPQLSISLGVATSQADIPLEKVISQADDAMYARKHAYFHRRKDDPQ
ncbi:MAG: GGDEF domain-containing protein [Chloroflexota bacterium]